MLAYEQPSDNQTPTTFAEDEGLHENFAKCCKGSDLASAMSIS